MHRKAPVRPVLVVVAHVAVRHPAEMAFVHDEETIAASRAARGVGSTERTPRSPDGMPRQHPEEHFGRGPVEISLISAVPTHALCTHTQDRFGERHRRAGRRGTAAHRLHLAAHTLHTHAYAGLIRPREKAPRNSDPRHESQREPAGHSVVHTQKGAKK